MENKKNLENFINFGTFAAAEVDMLRPEFEKRGIPVKILYPGTNIGTEATAQAGWTAYTIMIRERDIKPALDVCKTFNIKARYKIPLPKVLYTKLNRCIFIVIFVLWLLIIVLGSLGTLQDETLVGVLIGMLFLTALSFLVSIGYRVIRRKHGGRRSFSKIGVLIILVVIIAGGILSYQYSMKPEEGLRSSDLAEEIVDWQIFKTDYFGFEIEYPSDWLTNVNLQNISTVKPNEWWPVDTLPKGHAEVFFERTGVRSIDELIAEKFSPSTNNLLLSDSRLNINDKSARVIVYSCRDCEETYIPELDKNIPGKEGKVVFFSDNNEVVYLWLVYYKGDERKDYYINTFEKMISTFSFIERKTDESDDWKTYRNEGYGFQFRYPTKWRPVEDDFARSVQLQAVENDEVVAIAGGIFIISKPISSPTNSPYLEMFVSDSLCPIMAGARDLSGQTQYEEYVYCLTGKEIQISAGIWKGAVECSAPQWYGMEIDPSYCPHQFWIDTRDFFYVAHFNFFEPIRENSDEEIFFEKFLKGFSFFPAVQ